MWKSTIGFTETSLSTLLKFGPPKTEITPGLRFLLSQDLLNLSLSSENSSFGREYLVGCHEIF